MGSGDCCYPKFNPENIDATVCVDSASTFCVSACRIESVSLVERNHSNRERKNKESVVEKCASGCRGIESEGTSIVSAKKKRKRNGSRDPISVSMDQNLGD